MFNKLIESTNHAAENKRRATFMLGTTAMYGALLVAGGIASVYAYDAHLENQNLQLVSIVIPASQPEPPRPPEPRVSQPRVSKDNEVSTVTEINTMRTDIAPPDKITAVAHNVAPPDIPYAVLDRNNSVPTQRNVNFDEGRNTDGADNSTEKPLPLPPVKPAKPQPTPEVKVEPTPKPVPKNTVVSLGVANAKALSLPKPSYPAIAKAAGAFGVVQVQISLDETGKVTSARPLSGHPLLQAEAVRAAYQARFSPTLLSGQPVKATGIINYNFVRQ